MPPLDDVIGHESHVVADENSRTEGDADRETLVVRVPQADRIFIIGDPERLRLIRHETRSRTMSLKDKAIVMTGGSRGLGLGPVEALVDQGAKPGDRKVGRISDLRRCHP